VPDLSPHRADAVLWREISLLTPLFGMQADTWECFCGQKAAECDQKAEQHEAAIAAGNEAEMAAWLDQREIPPQVE
jgi:hypothetical protein